MTPSDLGYFELTPQEFADQCREANLVPTLHATPAEAMAAAGFRAWPSGLLPWDRPCGPTHVLAWPTGYCMVSKQMWAALGGT